jgi:DNA mismatch repair ATPase MutS
MPEVILLHCPADSKIHTILQCLEVKNLQYLNITYKDLVDSLRTFFNTIYTDEVKISTSIAEIVENLTDNSIMALYTIYSLLLKAVNMLHNHITEHSLVFLRIQFSDILFISNKTRKELKVFEEKLHPSLVKGKGRSKEGLSVFSVFDKCITVQGKRIMRHFFTYPVHNRDTLKLRYDMIADFMGLKNYGIVKSLITELKNIKDMEKMLKELSKFMINYKIWNSLYYSQNSVLKILETFKKQMLEGGGNRFKLLSGLYSRICVDNLEKILDFLNNCLDFSKEEFKPKIKIGVNEDLDMLRTEYNNLNEILSKHAIDYSKTLPKDSFLEKFMYVFIPQLGYMLAIEKSQSYYSFLRKVKNFESIEGNEIDNLRVDIKKEGNEEVKDIGGDAENLEELLIPNNFEDRMKDEQVIEEEDDEEQEEIQNFEETQILHSIVFRDLNLTFQFHSEDTVYFKNDITKALDNLYGDLSARIIDIENAIFREISKQILEYSKDIILANEFVANLDFFLTFYLLAEKLNLTRPIPSESVFIFNEGRNLLSELLNDTQYIRHTFKSNEKSIYLITGNISSGKSTFLREVGLMAYLAQIGSYVPAEGFRFEPFKKILTNIDILESSIDNLSGFTIELKNIKSILDILENDAQIEGSSTLVILDDPYRKTSSLNKKSLCGGTISYLNKLIQQAKGNIKIFISLSREVLDSLVKKDVVDPSMTGLYEMRTGFVKSNSNIITGDIPINLYELKQIGIDECHIKQDNDGENNLFLARENGLNNNIFLRSFEISNIIGEGRKLFPDVFRMNKIIENLKFQKQFLKLSDNIGELTEKINLILENSIDILK